MSRTLLQAFPGGIDGGTFTGSAGGARVVVEPTHPGERVVQLWIEDHGRESVGATLPLREYRAYVVALVARLALLDPDEFPLTLAVTPTGPFVHLDRGAVCTPLPLPAGGGDGK